MPFELFERRIREQLDRMLGPGGFDAAREIAGITVHRWSHGNAGGTSAPCDPDWTERPDAPWVVSRQRFGRIAVANSDAAATSLTNPAFAQSHRAVMELSSTTSRGPCMTTADPSTTGGCSQQNYSQGRDSGFRDPSGKVCLPTWARTGAACLRITVRRCAARCRPPARR